MSLGDGRKQSTGVGEDPSKDAGDCGPLTLLGIHAVNYLPGHRIQGPKLGKPEREAFQGKGHKTLGSYSGGGIMSTVVEVLKLPSRARQENR